jgi:hypothetical protein
MVAPSVKLNPLRVSIMLFGRKRSFPIRVAQDSKLIPPHVELPSCRLNSGPVLLTPGL